jgi:hypothetical protein
MEWISLLAFTFYKYIKENINVVYYNIVFLAEISSRECLVGSRKYISVGPISPRPTTSKRFKIMDEIVCIMCRYTFSAIQIEKTSYFFLGC